MSTIDLNTNKPYIGCFFRSTGLLGRIVKPAVKVYVFDVSEHFTLTSCHPQSYMETKVQNRLHLFPNLRYRAVNFHLQIQRFI